MGTRNTQEEGRDKAQALPLLTPLGPHLQVLPEAPVLKFTVLGWSGAENVVCVQLWSSTVDVCLFFKRDRKGEHKQQG